MEINLPSSATIFEANHPPEILSDEKLREILQNDQLKGLLHGPAIIIINDHHRSTPSGRILEILAELYSEIAQIDYIVIASGTHEDPTDKELSILTHRVEDVFDCELLLHDADGIEVELVNLGITSRGTEVKVHPVILDYENIICINSVEPHYFAGFTGGIKSIIPGLAAKSTVERNHSWALDEQSGPTLVENNPLQLDLWEAGEFTKKDFFGIQMVNFQDEIFHLSLGPLKEAFNQARKVSFSIYSLAVGKQFDVVVSIVYPPLDKSLYQAQKGIENTRAILRSGGEMILVAKCDEGIGNEAFYSTMKKYHSPDEILDNLNRENYRFGDHKAYKFASLAKDCKITIVGELSLTQAHQVFAKSISFDQLETYLSHLNLQNKSMAIVLDSAALSLSYS